MNSNLAHNILNIAMIVVAALTAGMTASGCTTTAAGGLDCSASWISPEYAGVVIAVIGVVKMAINVMRDGVKGLSKKQPPVQK